jgi:hypothetical protein
VKSPVPLQDVGITVLSWGMGHWLILSSENYENSFIEGAYNILAVFKFKIITCFKSNRSLKKATSLMIPH